MRHTRSLTIFALISMSVLLMLLPGTLPRDIIPLGSPYLLAGAYVPPGPEPYIGASSSSVDPIKNDNDDATLLTVEAIDDVSISSVKADLTLIGQGIENMYDDGILGDDVTAGDDVYSLSIKIPLSISPGTYLISFTAYDGNSNTNTTSLDIHVIQGDAAPRLKTGIIIPISKSCVEEESITVKLSDYMEDPEGQSLAFSVWDGVLRQTETATLNHFRATISGDVLTLLARENENGVEIIKIDADDGSHFLSDTDAGFFELRVSIVATNDAPIIEAIRPEYPTLENEFLFGSAGKVEVSAVEDARSVWSLRGTDIDGDDISWSIGPVNPAITIDASSGNITFIPRQVDVGVHEYSLQAFDHNGTSALSSEVSLLFNVSNVNDRPSIVPSGPLAGRDDINVTTLEPLDLEVIVTDDDPGDELTVSWRSDLSGDLGYGLALNRSIPQVGVHTITATVYDGKLTNQTSFIVTVKSGTTLTEADLERSYTDPVQDDLLLTFNSLLSLESRDMGKNPDLDLVGLESHVSGADLLINLTTSGDLMVDQRQGYLKYTVYLVRLNHTEKAVNDDATLMLTGFYEPPLNETYHVSMVESSFFYPSSAAFLSSIGPGVISSDMRTITFTVSIDKLQAVLGIGSGSDLALFATVEYETLSLNQYKYSYDSIGQGAQVPYGYIAPAGEKEDHTGMYVAVGLIIAIILFIVIAIVAIVFIVRRTNDTYVAPRRGQKSFEDLGSTRDRTRASLLSSNTNDSPKRALTASELYGEKAGAPPGAPPPGAPQGAPPPGAPQGAPPQGAPPQGAPPPPPGQL